MKREYIYGVETMIPVVIDLDECQDLIKAGNEDQIETLAYHEAMEKLKEMALKGSLDIMVDETSDLDPEAKDTGGSRCDRCGVKMEDWKRANEQGKDCEGGNCTLCGDDLCSRCAGGWTEDGICAKCVEDALTFYAKARNECVNLEGGLTWENFHKHIYDKQYVAAVKQLRLDIARDGNHELQAQPSENYRKCVNSAVQAKNAENMMKFPPFGQKFDTAKKRYDLVPWDAFEQAVDRFTFGAEKYAPDNWKTVPDPINRYFSALMRHLVAWRNGEDLDPEAPELTHIGAVLWNALVLTWFDMQRHENPNKKPEKGGCGSGSCNCLA